MNYEHLAVLALFTLFYSIVAGRVEKMPMSGPIIFVVFGAAVGPLGAGLFVPEVDAELGQSLSELALAVVLFADASNTDLSALRRSRQIPSRRRYCLALRPVSWSCPACR